ncbi:helix-turn-helix domain-containing protein [Mobiluncus mulieris]
MTAYKFTQEKGQNMTELNEKLLKATEVAEILNISRSKVYLLKDRRQIGFVDDGYIRFSPEDVAEYIEKHRVKAIA